MDNIIIINNLNYYYHNRIKNTNTKALDNVNLSFKRGMRIVVCGKNGAGKSTLLSILAGKKLINEQEVLIFNKPVFHDTSLSDTIGYIGEWWSNDYAMNISIKNFFIKYQNSKRYKQLLKLFEINENKLISSLSTGEKKKVQILVSIIKKKDIYIFDEATESLDLISRKLLLDFLMKESIKYNCIIIYSTHIFDYMEKWSTHILYLSVGSVKFFSGTQSITSAKNYVSLADFVFNSMMNETKETGNISNLDELLQIDSE
ncbi:CCR4-associated factor 16, putative [Hepatocystis sp. ex Piliocolobus tephrosceles]|nr:CCR4-associated factor 16, putative [Hepatocystis sp. ex Piliocolobus tephrosceles]